MAPGGSGYTPSDGASTCRLSLSTACCRLWARLLIWPTEPGEHPSEHRLARLWRDVTRTARP